MKLNCSRLMLAGLATALIGSVGTSALAQKKYDTGADDK